MSRRDENFLHRLVNRLSDHKEFKFARALIDQAAQGAEKPAFLNDVINMESENSFSLYDRK